MIRAKLPIDYDQEPKVYTKCKSGEKCKHCPNINRTGHIISHSTGRKYQCVFNGCCQSRNLIYCITCKNCGLQYVGQTKTTLKTRINNHKSTIRTKKDLPVPCHMLSHNDTSDPKLEIHILQYIRGNPDSDLAKQSRDRTEWDWMARLNTLVPNGMNLQE